MVATYFDDLKGRLMSQKQQAIIEAAKSSPIVAVALWDKLASVPVEKWVSVVALIYGLLQIYFLVRDRRTKKRGGRNGR